MHYKYLYRSSSSMEFQGKRAEALKRAKEYGMYIKEERNGYWVLVKNSEAVVFELDELNKVLRQCDPRPYMKRIQGRKRITENQVIKLIDNLNARTIMFDDVYKEDKYTKN